jgi:hypothetical protein
VPARGASGSIQIPRGSQMPQISWPRPLPTAIALVLLMPSEAIAQSRPGFQVLRFDEDWSVLSGAPGGAPEGALKFVPLGGTSFLSFGGQVRYRAEGVRNFMLGGTGTRDDSFSLFRAMVHADLHLGPYLRVFAEGRHAHAAGRELPGGRRPLDHDRFDLQNGFLEAAASIGGDRVTARLGRQELLIGKQRLVSPLDWSNTRRTFEGARISLARPGRSAEAFWTRPVEIRQDGPNRAKAGTHFYGAAVRGAGRALVAWEAYGLGLRDDQPVRFAGVEGRQHRVTVGGRIAVGDLDGRGLLDVEAGAQGGSIADRSIRASFIAADASRRFSAAPLRPTVTIGADASSGNGDGDPTRLGTFHQLFPLGHAYAGRADVLGRQNLLEARLVLEGLLAPDLRVRASGHQFGRNSLADGAYAVNGALLEPAGGRDERAIGREIDLSATHQSTRHLRLEAGYGRFSPGPFLRERAAGALDVDWVFLSAAYTF